MIVGISGKIGSGKDTVGQIIQYLESDWSKAGLAQNDLEKSFKMWLTSGNTGSSWEIKKFADKLKDIVCLLIGYTREQLEDRVLKEKELGEDWVIYKGFSGGITSIFNTWDEAYAYSEEMAHNVTKEMLTPRKILQLLGTDCGRDIIHPNIWVNSLMADYISYSARGSSYEFVESKWIVTDTRFTNEAEAILRKKGVVFRVNRYPQTLTKCKGPNDCVEIPFDKNNLQHLKLYQAECARAHESETALDEYGKFTEVIDNNGSIKDLIEKVREILIKYNLA